MPDVPSEPLSTKLGFLLKHLQIRLSAAVTEALAPFGIDGRELATLKVLADEYPLSQLEAAGRLNVDRTTMVTVLDGLEDKALVVRRRSAEDRRKNILELTDKGRSCLKDAESARGEIESRFLAPIGRTNAARLMRDLQILLTAD